LLLEVLLGLLVLFDLLDEEAATDAARATVFPCPILDKESSEGIILSLGRLGGKLRLWEITYHMEGSLTLEIKCINIGIII